MKNVYATALILCISATSLFAQNVGISTNTPNAKLDVVSTNSGVLIPRLALTGANDVTTVPSRTTSEMVYNTATAGSGVNAITPGFYFWNGSKWERIKVGAEGEDHDWYESGATAPNSINDNIYTQGNVGIGNTSPSQKLHVTGNARITGLVNGIVKADASGNLSATTLTGSTSDVLRGDGTFGPGSAFGDNLGNHSATANLLMNGREVIFNNTSGTVYGIGLDAWGGSGTVVTSDNIVTFTESDASVIKAYWSMNDGYFAFDHQIRAYDASGLSLQDDAGFNAIHIEDGGQVGIGTTAPTAQLHVNGTTRITTLANGVVKADASGNLSTTTFTGSASDVLLGNGTFGPGSAFGDNLGNHTATTDLNLNGNILKSGGTGSNVDHIWFDDAAIGGAGGNWHFVADATSKATGNSRVTAGHVYMTSATQDNYLAGKLGVGNTSPSYTIDVSSGGTISANDGYVRNVKAFYLKDWDDDTGGSDDKYRLLGRDGAWQFYNGGVVVGNYNNAQWTDLADGTLIVEGKVGIGATDPADKLVVSGGRVEFTSTTDASGTSGSGVLEIANSLRLDGDEIITNSNSILYLQNGNNGDLRVDGSTFAVDASINRVGVGVTNPASTLEVAGDIRLSGNSSNIYYENNYETNKEWQLVYVDDFESGTDGWVANYVTSTGNNGITRESNGSASFSYWVRPTYGPNRALKKYYTLSGISCTEIRVEMTYYFLDSWDGENAWVAVGGSESYSSGVRPSPVWNYRWHHDYGDPAGSTNLSFWGGSWSDGVQNLTAQFDHDMGTGFWLFAGAKLNDGTDDEHFAIDNVRVYVR